MLNTNFLMSPFFIDEILILTLHSAEGRFNQYELKLY
jgi:hypothetical protein